MVEMNLNQFSEEYFKLNEDATNALSMLEELTGKGVIFRLVTKNEADTYYYLKVKLARKFMESHIILINTDIVKDKNQLNYYIIHEVMHGMRYFSSDESLRKVLASKNGAVESVVSKIMKDEKEKILKYQIPSNEYEKYCSFMVSTTMQLLANASVDARIELSIYDKFPDTRNLQKKCLKEYVKDIVKGFDPKNTALVPNWVLDKAIPMNYAYLLTITPIIGKGWMSKANACLNNELKNKVDSLMIDLSTPDKGQETDNNTIMSWAEKIGVTDMIGQKDFEDISMAYMFQN